MSETIDLGSHIRTMEEVDNAGNDRLLILLASLAGLAASVAVPVVLFGDKIVQAISGQ